MKLKVSVLGGEFDDTSNETAFRIAANDAFQKGLEQGKPILLEPVMKLDITTPEDYLGDFVGDLQAERKLLLRAKDQNPASPRFQ